MDWRLGERDLKSGGDWGKTYLAGMWEGVAAGTGSDHRAARKRAVNRTFAATRFRRKIQVGPKPTGPVHWAWMNPAKVFG
jgi:hypothetical protein